MDADQLQRMLVTQISQIDDIRETTRSSPEFIKWQRDTKLLLEHGFGSPSREVSEFCSIQYWSMAWGAGHRHNPHSTGFTRGIDKARALLNSFLDQIKNYGVPALAPSLAKGNRVNITKVLFLAANPLSGTRLRLDEEVREVEEKIRLSEFRDRLALVSRWAVRPGDLMQALNELQPRIVHFSGHGSTNELILEDKIGNAIPVEGEALAALFESVGTSVRLVVLNACFSSSVAAAVVQHVDFVIGMDFSVGDDAAVVFAAALYRALGFGKSVENAYQQANVALKLEGLGNSAQASLFVKPGISAADTILVTPQAAAPATTRREPVGDGTPTGPAVKPVVSRTWTSRDSANDVIRHAAAKDGYVLVVTTLGGLNIQAGNETLCSGARGRDEAQWLSTLDYLVQDRLLERKNTEGTVYALTVKGYELADTLK